MTTPLQRRPPRLTLKELFLRLCQFTTPTGYESYCWNFLPLSNEMYLSEIDEKGNVHVYVPTADDKDSRIMWSSHLDTADRFPTLVQFRESKDGMIRTDKKSILGADCKTGVAIMVKMIEAGIPGWYVFHMGEERGMVGSRWIAKQKKRWMQKPQIAIAFDRKGYSDVITHQGGERTASDAFAAALSALLNKGTGMMYAPDDGGSFTDTKAYAGIIPECTNISVGYFQQHTTSEHQDMPFAERLLAAILKHGNEWENLPAVRDPSKTEYKSWGHSYVYRPKGQWWSGENEDVPVSRSVTKALPAPSVAAANGRTDWVTIRKEELAALHTSIHPEGVYCGFCPVCKSMCRSKQKLVVPAMCPKLTCGGLIERIWTSFPIPATYVPCQCPQCKTQLTFNDVKPENGTFICDSCSADLVFNSRIPLDQLYLRLANPSDSADYLVFPTTPPVVSATKVTAADLNAKVAELQETSPISRKTAKRLIRLKEAQQRASQYTKSTQLYRGL